MLTSYFGCSILFFIIRVYLVIENNKFKKKELMTHKKEYRARFYDKKDGTSDSSNGRYTHEIYCGSDDKKEAFLVAREELARMAECRRNGDNDEEVDDDIESIKNGFNSYWYDQRTRHFVMFSKKIKKI